MKKVENYQQKLDYVKLIFSQLSKEKMKAAMHNVLTSDMMGPMTHNIHLEHLRRKTR